MEIYGAANRPCETAKYTYRYGDYRVHEMPGVLYDVEKNGERFLKYSYDGLGRVTTRQVGELANKETYTYQAGVNGTTTTQVERFKDLEGVETYYTYDAVGNIVSSIGPHGINSYVYDGLGRMIRADHGYGADCTETYEYDGRGNIVSRKRYMYTSPEIPVQDQVLRETITYKYEDDSFADLLTEYNGQALTYDTIGNPLTYRDGMHMTWKHGRSLQSIVKDGVTQGSYNYNGDGLRTYKSTNGYGTTEYHILDGQYVGETKSINGKTYHTLYLYDDGGSIIGLQSGGETYYLSKTLEGDVTAVLDESGTKAAQYVYDMWGKLVGVYDGAGKAVTDPEHIALRNPFRYRGYMYDEESGLYYLQSRYYDPVTGRFVNADGFVSTGQGLMGNNMFAYCNNNPVMRADPDGEPWGVVGLIAVGLFLLSGCSSDSKPVSEPELPKPNVKPYSSYGGGTGNVYIVTEDKVAEVESGKSDTDVVIAGQRINNNRFSLQAV